MLVTINAAVKELMASYVKYPPRKLQSETYTGPITLSQYERFHFLVTCWPRMGSRFRYRTEIENVRHFGPAAAPFVWSRVGPHPKPPPRLAWRGLGRGSGGALAG